MITSIEAVDFLSHSKTKLDFESGMTVFVGQNGTGKSSMVDAITFSLFGRHTRQSNKRLIKHGSNQGYAKISFSINNKNYQAERKIDSKGSLSSKFSEISNGEEFHIASGERRQYGESMTKEIEKRIGLDFEKLKIASIVQQGELNAIINAKPKEFKELLNAIIGIDRLDVASESMKIAVGDFRRDICKKEGYDDTHIEILVRNLKANQEDVKNARPEMSRLARVQEATQKELEDLRGRIEADASKTAKISQLRARKDELVTYFEQTVRRIQREIGDMRRKISDCQGCFELADQKEGLETKVRKTEQAIEDTSKKIQEMSNQAASLREKQNLASRLQLKDGRCPVCDSRVDKLNPLFQEEHLSQELAILQKQITLKEEEKYVYIQKRRDFSDKLQKAKEAEATLKAHSVTHRQELTQLQEEIEAMAQKIPAHAGDNLFEISQIDSHARAIFEDVLNMEREVKGFDEQNFSSLKNQAAQKQSELSQINQQIGAVSQRVAKSEDQIKTLQKTIEELKIVKDYVENLNMIQTNVFGRDGPVATSLRSWALNMISAKSSEYLAPLNTQIQRVSLSEKTREISVTCHSRDNVLNLDSLSGGEKVCVALALRLGMANLLGPSDLRLMILDEPTANLDAERKKSLVGVLSQLSNISNSGAPMQFLIITHDAEIFEDAAVEQIYKFELTDTGSRVVAL